MCAASYTPRKRLSSAAMAGPRQQQQQQQQPFGGYDYEFVREVPAELLCSNVCTKVLREPRLTDCCGQNFCESCLQRWLQKQATCPHCRAENFNHIVNKPLKRKIKELEILCPNHKQGCLTIVQLGELEAHLSPRQANGCGYVDVLCTNRCGEKVKRKHLQYHLEQQCPRRQYQCEHCKQEGTYMQITHRHYKQCPEYPLHCPNKCGSRRIPRKDLDSHRTQCPEEPAQCPFQEAGCSARLVRREIEEHMTNNVQQHLLYITRAFTKLKTEVSTLKAGIRSEVSFLQKAVENETVQRSLDYMETFLQPGSLALRNEGEKVTFRMTSVSDNQLEGTVWHSPPFYYREGYKMCLTVMSNFQFTTFSICLMKGEYDSRLTWPIPCCDLHVELVTQQARTSQGSQDGATKWHLAMCSKCIRLNLQCLERVPGNKETQQVWGAVASSISDEYLLHNSLVIQVTHAGKHVCQQH